MDGKHGCPGRGRPETPFCLGAGRRRFLQLGLTGAAAAALPILPGRAFAGPVPAGVDASAASPELAELMTAFFAAKSRQDLDATMAFFSPDLVTYIDAALGWDIAGHDALRDLFAQYMPQWPETARSYPTRIVGDLDGGAFVAFADTPELFGGELRILAAIDFRDGKILRWIDHWDSRGWPNLYGIEKAHLTDYRDDRVPSAGGRMGDVAGALFAALASGSPQPGGALLTDDVVFEDMALRMQLQGRTAVLAYLDRALPGLPYGPGARLRHVTGWDGGGAAEWTGAAPVGTGVSGLVLDGDGRIARMTTVYDAGLYDAPALAGMAAAVLDL